MWDDWEHACIFWGFRNVHGNRSSLVCGVGFSASWLIVRARVIATALMIAIVPFSPLHPILPNSTRPWPSSNEKREIFGLTSRVSASCVTRNHRKLWWLVVSFSLPKALTGFFFIVFKKHATHSGWILTYLLPSLYSYQIELLRKGVLRYAWENGCWMWFLGLKQSDIKLKHGIKFKSEGGWSDSCEHVNPRAWVWFLFFLKKKEKNKKKN
jgi:hypothetical protein